MTREEYLEQRLLINEAVLIHLGNLLEAHFPSMCNQIESLGKQWTKEINKLTVENMNYER